MRESQHFGAGFLFVGVSRTILKKYGYLDGERYLIQYLSSRGRITAEPNQLTPQLIKTYLLTPICQSDGRRNIYEYVNVYVVISDQWRCWDLHPS